MDLGDFLAHRAGWPFDVTDRPLWSLGAFDESAPPILPLGGSPHRSPATRATETFGGRQVKPRGHFVNLAPPTNLGSAEHVRPMGEVARVRAASSTDQEQTNGRSWRGALLVVASVVEARGSANQPDERSQHHSQEVGEVFERLDVPERCHNNYQDHCGEEREHSSCEHASSSLAGLIHLKVRLDQNWLRRQRDFVLYEQTVLA